jgi:calcium-independent phospholipase A2-gamma
LYPNVPVECVVSIGTGYAASNSPLSSMGWDVLVNQLVASSTDTEDVHALLRDFLPPDKYFRFNPILPDAMRIDEKDKAILAKLKDLAQKHISDVEAGPEGKHFGKLLTLLRGHK